MFYSLKSSEDLAYSILFKYKSTKNVVKMFAGSRPAETTPINPNYPSLA